MIDLRNLRDYCKKHSCFTCPIRFECTILNPSAWSDEVIDKIEKEVNG